MTLFKTLVSAHFLFCSLAYAATLKTRATGPFSLYAYSSDKTIGDDLGGLPIYYADGYAYIGKQALSNSSVASNITFNPTAADTTTWSISANSTTNSSDIDGKYLYVNPSEGAFDQVGFTTSNDTSSSISTSGFDFYGTTAFWVSPSGAWQSFFYATPTGQDNNWALKWNSNQTSDGTSFPVMVVNKPPSRAPPTTTT